MQVRQKIGADVYIGAPDDSLARMARVTLWDARKTLRLSLLPWWADGRLSLGPADAARRVRMVNSTAAEAGRKNPVPWFDPDTAMTLRASVEMTRDTRYLQGEVPSANGLCSARGMAKVINTYAAMTDHHAKYAFITYNVIVHRLLASWQIRAVRVVIASDFCRRRPGNRCTAPARRGRTLVWRACR